MLRSVIDAVVASQDSGLTCQEATSCAGEPFTPILSLSPCSTLCRKVGDPKNLFFAHQILVTDISICLQPHASFQFSEQILYPDIYPIQVSIVITMFSYVCSLPLFREYAWAS